MIAALAFLAPPASGATLQNDAWNGGASNCQMGFVAGEFAAAAFDAPPADYPIVVESVQALGCNEARDVEFAIYPDDLDTDAEPDGAPIWSTASSVSLAPGLQTFPVTGDPLVIDEGGIRVAVSGVTEGVPIATDAAGNGTVPKRNMIFSEGSWAFSEDFLVSNDFVLRAVVSPYLKAKITKKPKKKVKTKANKVSVTFKFSSETDGADFECSLDGKPFDACDSPELYRVGKGKHEFEVRAVAGANTGDEARYVFKVVKK